MDFESSKRPQASPVLEGTLAPRLPGTLAGVPWPRPPLLPGKPQEATSETSLEAQKVRRVRDS